MGDRYDRRGGRATRGLDRLRGLPETVSPSRRTTPDPEISRFKGKPPPEIMAWGLPEIGHNGGPPLDEPVNNMFVRWRWKKAHAEAWKNPSLSVLKFRIARAEAAGVSYHEYMLELLDTGRHLQKQDVEARRRIDNGKL